MRSIIVSLTLCLAALAGNGASVSPYPGARIFWDISTEKSVNPGGYARVIELQDGRLMCVYQHSGISVSISENGGESWSTGVVIATNPSQISEAVPDVVQLADGTIVVGYNPRPKEPYSDDRKFGIRCRRSTDRGETWSKEIFIHDGLSVFNDGCWEPSFLELPSGELQCYFADEGPYTSSSEQQISMCRSFDGGLTWSEAECVSFRPKNRDGMPVPILLRDPDEIVVIVEDSGWYGNYGKFTPTTVRCPLDVNWHGYHVGGPEDANRNRCPVTLPNASMGAPYLRQMPDGITVVSCQGYYNRTGGNREMFVYTGDDRARNFRALSRPFNIAESSEALWPSVAVVDGGKALMAVAGVDGTVKVIKGYPMRSATIAYSEKVTLDGKFTSGEVYTHPKRNLLPMGTVCRNRTMIDLAYDAENLYFTARVLDNEVINTNTTDNDFVTLYIDPANLSTNIVAEGLHRFDFDSSGALRYRNVSGNIWRLQRDFTAVDYKCTAAARNYIVEAAIPWTVLCPGITPGSVDNLPATMRIAIEINDKDTAATTVETMADVDRTKSSTWFEVNLARPSGVQPVAAGSSAPDIALASGGVVTACGAVSISAHDVAGRLASAGADTLTLPAHGLYIIRAVGSDGASTVRKFVY